MYLVYCRKDWTLVQACLRRIWDSQKSHAEERVPAPRREGGPYGFRGTGDQPTHRSHSSMSRWLWNFTKHLPSSLWKKFVCYNGGDFRIWSRYNENLGKKWGSSENVVVFGGGGQCMISSGTALNRILANRNINLTDAIKIFVTFKCLLKICTCVH